MKKIDVHCHTTNRPLKHTVAADASISAISEHMKKHNVTHTLLLATYFPHRQSGISNFRMRSWIDRWRNLHGHGTKFLMFGSLDFEHYFYQGFNELEEMAERELMSGAKIYAGYQNIAHDKLEEVLKLCQRYKLPIMFHTGDCTHMNGKYADVTEFDKFLEKYSDVNFMYSHLCNPMIDKIIERVKRYPNLYTDMSGLLHSGRDDHEIPDHIASVRRFYDSCGINQLMWGTDFPVQTHDHSVLIAEKALHGVVPTDELKKFYYENAAKVLSVKPVVKEERRVPESHHTRCSWKNCPGDCFERYK